MLHDVKWTERFNETDDVIEIKYFLLQTVHEMVSQTNFANVSLPRS